MVRLAVRRLRSSMLALWHPLLFAAPRLLMPRICERQHALAALSPFAHPLPRPRWLNWDTEYSAWSGAGLPVDASFQFDRESYGWQAAAAWGGDYYTTAYNVRPRIRPAPLTRRLLVGKQICACPLRGNAFSPGSLANTFVLHSTFLGLLAAGQQVWRPLWPRQQRHGGGRRVWQ